MDILKKIILCISILIFSINLFYPTIDSSNLEVEKIVEIPKVYLVGDIEGMETKEDERKVGFSFVGEDLSFIKYAKIKIQGSSSLNYDKKNYTIKLYNDDSLSEKYKVDMGWGKENKYVLKANWIDKTHSRNIVSSRLVASVSKKYGLFENAPNNGNIDGFPVEVYINGEFLGLYTFNMPKDAWMLGLDEDKGDLAFVGEYSGDITFFRKKAEYGDWSLEVGIETQTNLEKLNRVYHFLNDSSDEEFYNEFTDYFNLDSVLNYYVLSEVLFLIDNISKNLILISNDGEIWYLVLYDLDASFGSDAYGYTLFNADDSIDANCSLLWERFSKIFDKEIRKRYFDLREEILTIENIHNVIDEFYKTISSESFEKEQAKWNDIPGYDINQMKDFISNRLIYLDEYFN